MLDQENKFYRIHLNTLITSLLNSGQILQGEVTCESLLGVKGLSESFLKQEEIIKIYAAHEDCSTQTNSKHGKRGLIYGTLTSISAFSEGLKMNEKTQLENSWFRFRT